MQDKCLHAVLSLFFSFFSSSSSSSFFKFFGPYPAILSGYSWLFIQELLLAVIGGLYGWPESNLLGCVQGKHPYLMYYGFSFCPHYFILCSNCIFTGKPLWQSEAETGSPFSVKAQSNYFWLCRSLNYLTMLLRAKLAMDNPWTMAMTVCPYNLIHLNLAWLNLSTGPQHLFSDLWPWT